MSSANETTVPPPSRSSQVLAAQPNTTHPSVILQMRLPFWRRHPYIVGNFILIAGAILTVIMTRPAEKPPEPQVVEVKRMPFAGVLHELGSIEARSETTVLTRTGGDIVWKTDDGKYVEAGEPVVRFDTKTLSDDIELKEKELLDKQDAVKRAQEDIKVTTERYKYLIRQAEIELKQAELDHQQTFESPTPDEKLDAELSLKSAKLDLDRAEVEMKGYEELAKQGYVSEATRKKKELDLATNRVNFAKAKTILDLTMMGFSADVKRVADLAVADAKKRLNIAKFNRDADLAVAQAALDLAKVELINAERDLNRKKQELEWTTVRAPLAGNVVFIDVPKGSMRNKSPIQVGETRAVGMDLCTICDTSLLRIRLWINESDIQNLTVGQKAKVTLPAIPGRTFEAVVSELAVMATDKNVAISSLALRKSGEAFVNVVLVKLDFVNLTEADRKTIRMGFTAEVYIQSTEMSGALTIPWTAVTYNADGMPCASVTTQNGAPEIRVLKLGRSDSERVEVVEGLKENDRVLAQTFVSAKGGGK